MRCNYLYLLLIPASVITFPIHYDDVIMSMMASQITSFTIVYSTVYSGADQSKHQSSASLAFVRGIHRGPVNSPHKWPVTRKMFPFDDIIRSCLNIVGPRQNGSHFADDVFEYNFLNENRCTSIHDYLKIVYGLFDNITGSDNGLAPIRRYATIWINGVCLVYWRTHTPPRLDVLTWGRHF